VLAFHIGTFMLLAPDVDTEKALHSRNHAAYRSLHWSKTVFHNVFVLKRCLSTHDDIEGANKVRTRCAISRRVGSTGRSRRARSIGRSANARAHTHNEIHKTIVNAHSTTPLNLMISV
jgi:hypothetical protein